MGRETHVVIGGGDMLEELRQLDMLFRNYPVMSKDLFLVVGVAQLSSGETFYLAGRESSIRATPCNYGLVLFLAKLAGCIALKNAFANQATIGFSRNCNSCRDRKLLRKHLLRTSDSGSFGVGMSEAVIGATESLHLPGECVDTVYSDINGERYQQ
jgi:hypothetical protein